MIEVCRCKKEGLPGMAVESGSGKGKYAGVRQRVVDDLESGRQTVANEKIRALLR